MKKTIRDIVAENAEAFKAASTTHKIREIAKAVGILNGTDSENRARWSPFCKALKTVCHRDYALMKEVASEHAAQELSKKVTHEVTFYSDAKARCERFAICGGDKSVVWYGRFFEGEGSEQSAAELETAKKAIWLARKIKEIRNLPAIRLNLFVDAQWLCTLSGKASILATMANTGSVELNIQWIRGTTNPADKWTTASGYQKWSEIDVASLAVEIGVIKEGDNQEDPEPEIAEQVESATRVQMAVVTPATTTTEQAVSRSERGSEFQEWFEAMGAEWPVLRDRMKAEGLSSSVRDLKVKEMVASWVASGKPQLTGAK